MALTPKYCLANALNCLKNRLEDAREAFKSIYENIPEPKEDIEIIRHFAARFGRSGCSLKKKRPLRELLYALELPLLNRTRI